VFDLLPLGYSGGASWRYIRVAVPRRHEAFVDAAVPVFVGAVIVVGEVLHGGHSVRLGPVLLALAAAGTLFGRRRWPGWTLAVSGALVAVLFHVDRSASTVAVLAPAVALYSLALNRGRPAQLLAGLAAVGAVLLADVLHSGQPGVLQTLGHVMLVAIPLLAAEQVRTHRAYLRLLEERLELAERTREQEAARRAEQERLRIARELHDVVAHTLTEINIQAGSTAERIPSSDARETLETIEQASHNAIGELRAILGVLRDPDNPEAPRAPSPGVEAIPELTARARQAGLEIHLDTTGEYPPRLSDAVSLAAYRIVQESLTNARRHAAGAPVTVHLHYDTSLLRIAVDNPATAGNGTNGATPSGVGITGMKERATALGGALRASAENGGFYVHAELPYEPGL
jgi:signal transduction histidine kinase